MKLEKSRQIMKPYRVALIQQQTRVIVDPKQRNEIIDENLSRIFELRSDLYASVYAKAKRWPNDGWADKKLQGTQETRKMAGEIIERLVKQGNLVRPKQRKGRKDAFKVACSRFNVSSIPDSAVRS